MIGLTHTFIPTAIEIIGCETNRLKCTIFLQELGHLLVITGDCMVT